MQAHRVVLSALALLVSASACVGGQGGLDERARDVGGLRAEQARATAKEAGLADDVIGVIADAAGAVGRTFTVTYDTGDGGRATVAQAPPRRRFDVSRPGAPTRATLVNERGSFACEQRDVTWACLPSRGPPPEVGPFAATDLERTIGSLSAARISYDLRVATRLLAGVDARCLVTERKPSAAGDPALGERGTLCVAPSGAVLAVDQPGQRLTAVEYSDDVDATTFVLPGPLATTTTSGPPTSR